MKEPNKDKKEAKPAKKNLEHDQSADYVVVIEIDSKPRTVSHEGREMI